MRNTKIIVVIFAMIAGCALPFFVPNYVIYLINLSAISIIGAIGLNILTGYTGLIAMGQGAFMGVGAYTAAILYTKVNAPFWITLPAAGGMAAVIGVFFGTPSLRLRGFYLAMSTLAAQVLLEYVFKNWESLTNGVAGISINPPSLLGISLQGDRPFYFLTLSLAIVGIIIGRNLFRTDTGRAFIGIRDRDIAANIVGIDILKYKLISFAISSFYAGIAGALLGYYMTIINPEGYGISVSIDYIAMIIIGGLGSIWGSVLGAVFVVIFPEVVDHGIQLITKFIALDYTFAAIRQIVFGLLIILFLLFEPRGLAAIMDKLVQKIRTLFIKWA